jgi:hypothetical protein
MADQAGPTTLVVVARRGEGRRLADPRGLPAEAVEEVVVVDDDGVDALQDIVYGRDIERILLPALDVLGEDVLAQEMILSGWRERGIDIWVEHRSDSEERHRAQAALGEIDEYGKIPWIP